MLSVSCCHYHAAAKIQWRVLKPSGIPLFEPRRDAHLPRWRLSHWAHLSVARFLDDVNLSSNPTERTGVLAAYMLLNRLSVQKCWVEHRALLLCLLGRLLLPQGEIMQFTHQCHVWTSVSPVSSMAYLSALRLRPPWFWCHKDWPRKDYFHPNALLRTISSAKGLAKYQRKELQLDCTLR